MIGLNYLFTRCKFGHNIRSGLQSEEEFIFQIPEKVTSIVADGRKEPRMKRSSVKKPLAPLPQQQLQVVMDHPQQVQQIQVQAQDHPQVSTTEQIYMEVADLEMAPDKNPEGQQQFAVS